MKYTKATDYALHIMAYMVTREGQEPISLQPLAKHMEISPTYLSKVLTLLVRAGLIQSTPGANGGYRLQKNRREINFLDVTQAIEGRGAFFTCEKDSSACHLQAVMREAEQRMETYLKSKTLYEIVENNFAHPQS